MLVVCGLAGIALALIGVEIYVMVREIDRATITSGLGSEKADVLATGLISILRDVGPLVGLAAAVYLLAPAADDDEEAHGYAALTSSDLRERP